jgi:hypothetical protein
VSRGGRETCAERVLCAGLRLRTGFDRRSPSPTDSCRARGDLRSVLRRGLVTCAVRVRGKYGSRQFHYPTQVQTAGGGIQSPSSPFLKNSMNGGLSYALSVVYSIRGLASLGSAGRCCLGDGGPEWHGFVSSTGLAFMQNRRLAETSSAEASAGKMCKTRTRRPQFSACLATCLGRCDAAQRSFSRKEWGDVLP